MQLLTEALEKREMLNLPECSRKSPRSLRWAGVMILSPTWHIKRGPGTRSDVIVVVLYICIHQSVELLWALTVIHEVRLQEVYVLILYKLVSTSPLWMILTYVMTTDHCLACYAWCSTFILHWLDSWLYFYSGSSAKTLLHFSFV